MVEVSAARTSSRKKSADHTGPSVMPLKIEGRVMKTSEGPAEGSMPALKTAGKIIAPASRATSVSSSVTWSAVRLRSASGRK